MARKPPSRLALTVTVSVTVLFIAWTMLVRATPVLDRMDEVLQAPPLRPNSALAQIVSAFGLLTWPGLVYAGLLGVALWAGRHRLRNLAAAATLAVVLGWGSSLLLSFMLRHPRPDGRLDTLTTWGWSYPSTHVTATVVAVIIVNATMVVTRQDRFVQLAWRTGGTAVVLVVAACRWAMSAHFASDLIGGLLLGGSVAALALVIADVTILPEHLAQIRIRRPRRVVDPDEPVVKRRCAIIYNPTKVTDLTTFRRHVEYQLSRGDWESPLWLETSSTDPGREMVATAVRKKVDLVLGAGGDGTIRVVTAGLAGSGIPFGLIPAGTGNLLARNLGIPLDEQAALEVAFGDHERRIDLVKITTDTAEEDHFAVMAGIGIDAVIMEATNPDLKKAVGSAAYFVSAAKSAGHPSLQATISVDGQEPFRRRASVIVIGNVGYLQANIPLIPDARADDGLLDLLVASPRGVKDWVKLTTHVLTRQRREDAQLDRLTASRVSIEVSPGDHYQLDGDTVGLCTRLEAEVVPGALVLRSSR
ncbi:MAG: diacylglycerol kinase family protein [Propionibacteriaceae bacterium]